MKLTQKKIEKPKKKYDEGIQKIFPLMFHIIKFQTKPFEQTITTERFHKEQQLL